MVWDGITMTARTQLHIDHGKVTGPYYHTNNRTPIVVPFARQTGCPCSQNGHSVPPAAERHHTTLISP